MVAVTEIIACFFSTHSKSLRMSSVGRLSMAFSMFGLLPFSKEAELDKHR